MEDSRFYRDGSATSLQLNLPKTVAVTVLAIMWTMGVLPFIVQLFSMKAWDSMASYPLVVSDALILAIGLPLCNRRADWVVIGSFVAISAISTLGFNHLSMIYWINGMRYYFPFLFLIPIMRYLMANPGRCAYFIRLMDKNLFWFLAIQVPCMLYQFFRRGAGDYVGGSLGNFQSGVISMAIYLISAYLMLRRWDYSRSYWDNLKANWILVFLLFPTFLNETKISFILFALYFFFIIPMDRKFLRRMLVVAPFLAVGIGVGAYLYANVTQEGGTVFDLQYLHDYTFGDEIILELVEQYVDDEQNDLITPDYARGVKFFIASMVIDDKPWTPMWGFGVGQFKGGSVIQESDFKHRFRFLVDGTQMMGLVWLLELGTVGLVWVLGWCLYAWRAFSRIGRQRNMQLELMTIFYFIVMALYSSNFMIVTYSILFMYMVYLSTHWLDTRHAGGEQQTPEGEGDARTISAADGALSDK